MFPPSSYDILGIGTNRPPSMGGSSLMNMNQTYSLGMSTYTQNNPQMTMIPPMAMFPQQPVKTGEKWKKLFVNNIPEDIPDDFMEKLLGQCGELAGWKRNKDEKGKCLKFGYIEYITVEGVLKCLRILNNWHISNQSLQIKPSQKTEMFLEQWKDLKRKEWVIRSSDDRRGFTTFESYLEKDDQQIKDNINNLMDKLGDAIQRVRHQKEIDEERKEHPRERERDHKKRQYKKDMERRAKEMINDWKRREEDRKRMRKKEKEKEEDNLRQKQKLLERELNMDSEEERKLKLRFKENRQRIKFRQKEMDEDEMERKKELLQFVPQEPQNDFDKLKPDYDENEQIEEEFNNKVKIPKFYKQASFVLQKQEIEINIDQGEQLNEGGLQMQISQQQQRNLQDQPVNSIFGDEFESLDKEQKVIKLNLPKIGNQAHREQKQKEEDLKKQNQENQDQQKRDKNQMQDDNSDSEDPKKAELIKEELKNLIKQIPQKKKDLFAFEIDWKLLAKSDVFERKVRPWLLQKSIEYLKEEEVNFVRMIIKKLNNQETAQNILKKVQIILDDDAEEFVIKLWRMLIFELLKLQKNLS